MLQVGSRVGQFMFVTHWTQYIVVVSQTGVAGVAAHCVLLVHDMTHVFEVVLQTRPVGQFVLDVH